MNGMMNTGNGTLQIDVIDITDQLQPILTLSPAEAARLTELETDIRQDIVSFIKVGQALAEIRDRRLYRQHYGTFEEYCKNKFGFSRQRGYQIIAASDAAQNVNPRLSQVIGEADCANWEKNIPSEKQARQLARLQPEDQKRIWQNAVARWEETGQRPTVRDVKKAVDALLEPPAHPEPVEEPPPEPPSGQTQGSQAQPRQSQIYIKQLKKFAGVISLEKALDWPTLSQEDVLRDIQQLFDMVKGNEPPRRDHEG